MLLDVSYSVTSQGLQRMRRTTPFQSTCPCRPLSFLRCRKKWGKWSFLEQSETNNIINDQIPFFQTKHADFQEFHVLRFWLFCRPGIQEIAPNKVCVWMTMTTLEAAKSGRPALPWWAFFGGFCLRCASSIWRAPIGASGQWCHSIGGCFRWRYDGHINVSFWLSFVLYIQVFKCNNQHPASTGQWNISMRSLCGRFKIFEPGAIWHKSFGDKSILSLRLRYC